MTRAVHAPYTVAQDEDGIGSAHAQMRPGVGANGRAIQQMLPSGNCARRWWP
jgi:hypothetical protein